jgi:predicted AAA+ superfamily ATPase
MCNHLIRLAFNIFPSSDYEYANKLFYWENALKKEVDFVIKLNGKYVPIEVKYQSDIKKDDLIGLQAFMQGGSSHQGIVITKNLLAIEEDLAFLPCCLFLTFI